jgi:hypothetical protein
MATNGNESVSPYTYANGDSFLGNKPTAGLTKREYFASAAMQGLLANSEFCSNIADEKDKLVSREVAKHASILADALITALNQ